MSLARLLTLPLEIRELVWEHVLTEADQTLVTFRLDAFQREYYSYSTQPALARVSRQIRSESLPIWYERNRFIFHTEDAKAQDVRTWLRCNELHLEHIRHITLWVRYIPPANAHLQGALAVSIDRRKKHDPWQVDPNWTWITVLRRPPDLARDASYLIEKLRDMTSSISKDRAGVDDYYALIYRLRLLYIQEKTSARQLE
ncbi:uncharacterized protein SEPMUDRAFT_146088 [Sphaerulina musiva SO2202]|uniref:2EXR domain-containing protein n=1 Tax=Sphaerulina musiva (strain SO2202) TaxID=692275 RepID=N1QN13_SPHMS|nr:uncharacterized protein SEPMUDRAFT_146088 [Sphaerulina musiva SO2202]EMF16974.1 hypothetical protein SEPMUDRAFT_146088 [Sphaerulina musiva SO2202]